MKDQERAKKRFIELQKKNLEKLKKTEKQVEKLREKYDPFTCTDMYRRDRCLYGPQCTAATVKVVMHPYSRCDTCGKLFWREILPNVDMYALNRNLPVTEPLCLEDSRFIAMFRERYGSWSCPECVKELRRLREQDSERRKRSYQKKAAKQRNAKEIDGVLCWQCHRCGEHKEPRLFPHQGSGKKYICRKCDEEERCGIEREWVVKKT